MALPSRVRPQPASGEDGAWEGPRALRARGVGIKIVEVDGGSHHGRAHVDARRDRALLRLGYRVLRISAQLVTELPEVAIARIREALRE